VSYSVVVAVMAGWLSGWEPPAGEQRPEVPCEERLTFELRADEDESLASEEKLKARFSEALAAEREMDH
jgi:hypothetical protein